MAKILFLLLLSFAGYSQKLQVFPFVLYGEKTVNLETHKVDFSSQLYNTPSELLFTSTTLDIKTFNWTENLTVDYKLDDKQFVFRTNSGELVLVFILKVKTEQFPKQQGLWVQYQNKSYMFLEKMK